MQEVRGACENTRAGRGRAVCEHDDFMDDLTTSMHGSLSAQTVFFESGLRDSVKEASIRWLEVDDTRGAVAGGRLPSS